MGFLLCLICPLKLAKFLYFKGGFHGSAHVCIIYLPVHAFRHWPSFSLFVNQSKERNLILRAKSRKTINHQNKWYGSTLSSIVDSVGKIH